MTSSSASAPVSGSSAPNRFDSLEQLRDTHADLLTRSTTAKDDPSFWEEVIEFVEKTCATGAILEDDADRFSAHGLITYWANVLYRVDRQPADTLLFDFDESWCPELPEAKRPYASPDEFRDGSAQHLYGWRRLIDDCVKRLDQNEVVAVIGSGGSGRTTLVQQGILPALQSDAIPGSAAWRVLPAIQPGDEPLHTLAGLFPAQDVIQVAEQFRQNREQLQRLLGDAAGPPALLIVSRFEDLFIRSRKEDCQAFLENLGAVVEAGIHRLILVIRPDYVGQITGFDKLGTAVQEGQVLMAFTARELRQAIEEPAKKVGLRFEPGLVDRILMDVQGDPAAATLLQFTLLQLWRNRRGNRITREAYERLGGGRLALKGAAERHFLSVDVRDHDVVRHVWLTLARQEVESSNESGSVDRQSFVLPGKSGEVIDRLLGELVAAGLVHRLPGHNGQYRYVLAHHTLVEVWPRLLEWLGEERDQRRHRQRLWAAAEQWRDSSRAKTLLWGGTALAEALQYPGLDDLTRQFLEASRKEEYWQSWWSRIKLALAVAIVGVVLLAISEVKRAESETKRVEAKAESDHKSAQIKFQKELSKKHEISKKELENIISRMSLDVGTRLQDQGDIADSVVWYGRAVELLESSKEAIDQEEFQSLVDHYRVRLGLAWKQVPTLIEFLDHEQLKAADVSRSCEWAVTASGDGTARLWNLRQRTDLKLEHSLEVNAANFSPNGDFLVTGTGKPDVGGEVYLWKVPDAPLDKESLRKLTPTKATFSKDGLQFSVDQVAFSPQGNVLLAVGSNTKEKVSAAAIWLFKDGWQIGVPDALISLPGIVASGTLSADGERVVFVCNDAVEKGSFTVRNVRTGDVVCASAHPDATAFQYACFSPDGKKLVTCAGAEKSGQAQLWSAENGTPLGAPFFHQKAVTHAAFSSDGKLLITCGEDGSALVWNANQSYSSPLRFNHSSGVTSVAFSPDVRYAATAGRDCKARVWDLATGKLVTTMNHGATVNKVQFYPDGRTLFSETRGALTIWELPDVNGGAAMLKSSASVRDAVISSGGAYVATLSRPAEDRPERADVRIWNIDGSERHRLHGKAKSIALSANGSKVVMLDGGPSARLWNAAAKEIIRELEHQEPITFARFSDDDRWIVTCGGKPGDCLGEVRLWNAGGDELFDLQGHTAPVTYAAFSPDGKRLVTVTGEANGQVGEAIVWDVPTGTLVRHFSEHKEPIFFARFSLSGKYIVTTSKDNTARVWKAETGVTGMAHGKTVELRQTADVVQASFSCDADGRYLVTASMNGEAVLWDVTTGESLLILPHGSGLKTATFGHGKLEEYILTAGNDGKAKIWDVRAAACGSEIQPDPLVGTLVHQGEVLIANFQPGDSSRIVTLSYLMPNRPAGHMNPLAEFVRTVQLQTWSIKPDDLQVQSVREHARLVAGRQGEDKSRSLEIIPAKILAKDWNNLRAGYLQARQATPTPIREADVAEALGMWSTAIWHLERSVKSGDRPELRARLASNYARLENWEKAVEEYTLAINNGMFTADNYVGRARAQLKLQPPAKKEAIADFAAALKINPRDVELLVEKAIVHESERDWRAAVAELSIALDAAGPRPDLLGHRGQNFANSMKWPEAIKDFEEALRLQPNEHERWKHSESLAYALEHDNKPLQALDVYEKIVGEPLAELAKALVASGRAVNLARTHDSSDKQRLARLLTVEGRLYAKLLRFESARKDLEEAKALGANSSILYGSVGSPGTELEFAL